VIGESDGIVEGTGKMDKAEVRRRYLQNDSGAFVEEAIDGLIMGSGGRLCRLEFNEHTRVVLSNVRPLPLKEKVAILTGGGSGHEPSFGGLVGDFLDASVCGEVFASPTTLAVSRAMDAIAGKPGCLVVVLNYTGDRLNFGISVEDAKRRGLRAKMVIVGDDIAIPGSRQPRGVAGMVFVLKIAGAAAERGGSLDEVYLVAEAAAQNVFSIGASFSTCSLPGKPRSDRLGDGNMEIGLGIHGEPGVETLPFGKAADICRKMVLRLKEAVGQERLDRPMALLVNNLGGLTKVEESLAVGASVKALREEGFSNIVLVASGVVMSSLDMQGFSISLLDLTCHPDAHDHLLRGTNAPGWAPFQPVVAEPAVVLSVAAAAISSDEPAAARSPATADGQRLKTLLEKALDAVASKADYLDELDSFVGDGDCGTTMLQGVEQVRNDMAGYDFDDPGEVMASLATTARSIGGTSGVLYRLGFAAASAHFAAHPKSSWPSVLKVACEGIQKYGGAELGDRTMLDALIPAAMETDPVKMAEAAEAGCEKTRYMEARAGRSAYIKKETLDGHPDPGSVAVCSWLSAIVQHL